MSICGHDKSINRQVQGVGVLELFAFEGAVLRLKQAAGVRTEKELAALLGMDASAFNKRKRRGSFPREHLEALAAARPDLRIDVQYVLTGKSARDTAVDLASSVATTYARGGPRHREVEAEETSNRQREQDQQVLSDLRRCSAADRSALLHLIASLAGR